MSHHHLVSNTAVSAHKFNRLQSQNLRRAVSFCLVALMLAMLPLSMQAQEIHTVTRPVRFARGRAVISGSAQQYTRYVYTFRASEGQGFDLRITGGVTVSVFGPGSRAPLAEDETEGFNSGLPNTGTYKVVVTNKSEGTSSVPFTLKMSLSAPEKY
jgi:hypothetical protein